ncbi:hypothetical protein ACSBLW_11070 [Thioclava sp. FR2]|uniref:hypothetical protein n=1 Tax=Thioclava sp. FR2 TaxID=3445780 RepID=UPI003EC026B9
MSTLAVPLQDLKSLTASEKSPSKFSCPLTVMFVLDCQKFPAGMLPVGRPRAR